MSSLPGRRSALLAVVALSVAGCATTAAPRRYAGFDGHHRAITTASPDAQAWFDQGLQLLYGFNHDEAIRSFQAAAAADPACAMAHWGVAYAHGLHINNPRMSAESSRRAFEAAAAALAALDDETAVERELVTAVSQRYASPPPDDRRPLDEAYAAAMEQAWARHAGDADVGALFAESLMNLQPWDLWTADGQPKGRAGEIVSVLEATLALDPSHPGANHFYIHAVEASREPARAVPAADRLLHLVPGSGHLVHMPSHIYTRVGRYADAADCNERAIAADRAYFERAPEPDFYSLYYVHNIHFLAYAAMMEGRWETAMGAARRLEREVPAAFLENYVHMADGLMGTPLHVMLRFGRWDAVLAEPEAPAFRLLSRAQRAYARGVALAALDRTQDARAELLRFEALAAEVPADWVVGNNASADVLALCRLMLQGELAFREGRADEAFAHLREAVEREDRLVYDEPPGWMQPVRHALGALLLAQGRAVDAEAVYREDLRRNPANGWSLLGLEQALAAQGQRDEIPTLAAARAAAWARADVAPAASCYCAPGVL